MSNISPGVMAVGWIVWIVCLVLNIYIAKKKNRSIALWVILSILISWIALIINLAMKPAPPKE